MTTGTISYFTHTFPHLQSSSVKNSKTRLQNCLIVMICQMALCQWNGLLPASGFCILGGVMVQYVSGTLDALDVSVF